MTSCATRKYSCTYTETKQDKPVYRSTGYVSSIDTNLMVVKLTSGIVVSDFNFDMCNYVVVKDNFAKVLNNYKGKVIKFEFIKSSEIKGDIIYSSTGCVEEVVINNDLASRNN
jgi:hypothetical protein